MFSPITKAQWKKVALNTAFAFVSTSVPVFVATLQSNGNLDQKAILSAGFGAVSAGIMAAFKIVEKALEQA